MNRRELSKAEYELWLRESGGLDEEVDDFAPHHDTEQAPKAERKRQNGPKAATTFILDRADPMQAARALVAAHPAPSTPNQLAAVAVAYVRFALDRPALFRIMFNEPCDRDNDERVAATEAVFGYVRSIVDRCFPGADANALATALWALVHGLACLHLDGKLDASDPQVVARHVRAAVRAVLAAS